MTNAASIFTAAHTRTRRIVAEHGVSYRMQFAICLRAAYQPQEATNMEITITRTANGKVGTAESKCGRYTWFWGQAGYVRDTVIGRSIYQMGYMRKESFGSDPVPADVQEEVREFHAAIQSARAEPIAQKPARASKAADIAKHRAYCDMHHEGDTGMRSPYSG